MDTQDSGERDYAGEQTLQLPVDGYPISEDAVAHWFQQTYRREPTDLELGAIISAMAERETTPPHVGPHAEPEGWKVGPSAPPADRR
ncbi:MAG TPA: hypothetical protein VFN42_02305 [Acetobacteraceae bacterium]|nr:hypothetical protein [Acetobacteraceae bacterium]